MTDEPDRALLTRHLSAQRRHVLSQLDGLADEQLRTAVLPSGWTPLGLVRHLTLSDERYWFEVVVAGGSLDYWPEGENADWHVGDDEAAGDVVEAYRAAIAVSDGILAATPLDAPPARPEAWWSEAGMHFPDVRSIVLHVLVETATHAGHLDAARESLDGRQYIVL
ncbi:DinB family protein [uncultured Phycicoccus sp.]|uniref:DinB family protein n=1 Tax=uncultured Phycicoccus sp. TaxID=661422 RepID=UPI00262F5369|nr:DinB family protein [uncultured Phycicoccus sp.]